MAGRENLLPDREHRLTAGTWVREKSGRPHNALWSVLLRLAVGKVAMPPKNFFRRLAEPRLYSSMAQRKLGPGFLRAARDRQPNNVETMLPTVAQSPYDAA